MSSNPNFICSNRLHCSNSYSAIVAFFVSILTCATASLGQVAYDKVGLDLNRFSLVKLWQLSCHV